MNIYIWGLAAFIIVCAIYGILVRIRGKRALRRFREEFGQFYADNHGDLTKKRYEVVKMAERHGFEEERSTRQKIEFCHGPTTFALAMASLLPASLFLIIPLVATALVFPLIFVSYQRVRMTIPFD